jgi:hypothetical protein
MAGAALEAEGVRPWAERRITTKSQSQYKPVPKNHTLLVMLVRQDPEEASGTVCFGTGQSFQSFILQPRTKLGASSGFDRSLTHELHHTPFTVAGW